MEKVILILIMVVSLSPLMERETDDCFVMNSNIENIDDSLKNTSLGFSLEEFIADITNPLNVAQIECEYASAFSFFFPSKVYYSIWLPPDIRLQHA